MHEHNWLLAEIDEKPEACHTLRIDQCPCGAQRAVWPEFEDFVEVGPGAPGEAMYVKVAIADLKYCELVKLCKVFMLTKIAWDEENDRIEAEAKHPPRMN